MPAINIEVDQSAALNRFLQLTRIPGISGDERAVAESIVEQLVSAGLDPAHIQFDQAHERTRIPGNCGNLIVTLPGSGEGPRTLLSAHMDTVPVCLGCDPVVQDGEVISRTAQGGQPTGLGADDRSGCAVILTAVIERLRAGDEKFPPAVICFLIQEEIGLEGARHLDTAMVGQVDAAFNFDGGSVSRYTIGATGGERIKIRFGGIPSHAGVAPEQGASAIVMAATAISDLQQRGLLGKIENEYGSATANVGVIQGGNATNVVTPEVVLRAEARSHDPAMRNRVVHEIRLAMERAAEQISNDAGQSGTVEFVSHVDYESFRLADDHRSVRMARAAIEAIGKTPEPKVGNGGLDANWLYRHGIEAVTLGCGQCNIHTVDERLSISDFEDACTIATRLITQS